MFSFQDDFMISWNLIHQLSAIAFDCLLPKIQWPFEFFCCGDIFGFDYIHCCCVCFGCWLWGLQQDARRNCGTSFSCLRWRIERFITIDVLIVRNPFLNLLDMWCHSHSNFCFVLFPSLVTSALCRLAL